MTRSTWCRLTYSRVERESSLSFIDSSAGFLEEESVSFDGCVFKLLESILTL